MTRRERIMPLGSPAGRRWRRDLDRQLDQLQAKHARPGGWPGAVVRVSLGQEEHHTWAGGSGRADDGAPMAADTGFHIASVGKAFTATLILQLAEEGRLGAHGVDAQFQSFDVLADLIGQAPCLSEAPFTIRQMLTHVSGLRDAFNDDGDLLAADNGGRPAPGSLGVHLRSARGKDPGQGRLWPAWDPERPGEATAGVMNWFIWGGGAARALASPPGARFHYSDTAYMILGLLAERLAGASYERLLRERIFRPLQMDANYLAYGEAAPAGWRRTVSDFAYGGGAVFSEGLDASWDWGGGGQVSTAADLERFLRALFAGGLFSQWETRNEMVEFVRPKGLPKDCTGMGLGVRRLKSPMGVELWGHAGAWSVQAFYAPAYDATITGTFNQPMALDERLRNWVFEVADSLTSLREPDPTWNYMQT